VILGLLLASTISRLSISGNYTKIYPCQPLIADIITSSFAAPSEKSHTAPLALVVFLSSSAFFSSHPS
jgi:hypothetical protein